MSRGGAIRRGVYEKIRYAKLLTASRLPFALLASAALFYRFLFKKPTICTRGTLQKKTMSHARDPEWTWSTGAAFLEALAGLVPLVLLLGS